LRQIPDENGVRGMSFWLACVHVFLEGAAAFMPLKSSLSYTEALASGLSHVRLKAIMTTQKSQKTPWYRLTLLA
jgi:hypothetical protein